MVINIRCHTPFRSPCIIPCPCIYINPLATSLSFQRKLSAAVAASSRSENYKLKSIRVPMCRHKFVDVTV